MTTTVDVVNQALQGFGSRTTVASLSEVSNEATQANLIYNQLLYETLRKAPWNCATTFGNLTLVTAAPGTAENPTAPTTRWEYGQPAPPWLYAYEYPFACLRPLWIVPNVQNNLGAVPIYPPGVVTGQTYMNNLGPVVPFKVVVEVLYTFAAAAVVAGGANYAVGDLIYLAGTPDGAAPIGIPGILQVATLAGSAVATVTPVNTVLGRSPATGGGYFSIQANPVAQASTSGSGSGATFNLSSWAQKNQRIILTNQADATLAYVKALSDPDVMDSLLLGAFTSILSARLCWALTKNTEIANGKIKEANEYILQARIADANEGITVNDVTPDWIKTRGVWSFNEIATGFDWGPLFPLYS